MKTIKRILCFIMVVAMVSAILPSKVEAAVKWTLVETSSKVKLNKKKVTLTITDSKKSPATTLKVNGLSKKVAKKAKWSTSNKKVATVKKGKVTAKKAGKATITCKVKSKKYKCKVTVVDKRTKGTALKITITKASEIGGTIQPNPDGGETWIPAENKITVTYKGKDITDKAKYTTKYKVKDPSPRYVEKPGIITNASSAVFWLTASYNGEKTTVKVEKQAVMDYYNECGCGIKFYDDFGGTKIGSHMEATALAGHGCGNYYIVPYVRYIDFVIVK